MVDVEVDDGGDAGGEGETTTAAAAGDDSGSAGASSSSARGKLSSKCVIRGVVRELRFLRVDVQRRKQRGSVAASSRFRASLREQQPNIIRQQSGFVVRKLKQLRRGTDSGNNKVRNTVRRFTKTCRQRHVHRHRCTSVPGGTGIAYAVPRCTSSGSVL